MSLTVIVLALVTAQRLGELALARRNTRALLARGGVEVAPGHYPAIVAVHAAWLAGLWLLAPAQPVDPRWLAAFVVLQALRVWVLATLRERWTTRIIVLPDTPLVRTGPYRLLSHPNYAVVIGEIAALPLAFGLPVFAGIFSLLNAAVLAVRIRAEQAALAESAAGGP
ncbi:isoprenylcysteine carboxyl methyltransferase family protein [Chelatococcus reniformis]|uniref:Membrane protein n=1 Tax=Chelatococcus reniformis TaxID=1494448 RepID=A0A916UQE5_9HYPH|nr:isoprenylcysteine carboxylmethyltransferase family protein [Chelatococcus reniformis]GGC82777.1 membrane protein [Chelatococcus reniformis]